jgi:hypothetical protein
LSQPSIASLTETKIGIAGDRRDLDVEAHVGRHEFLGLAQKLALLRDDGAELRHVLGGGLRRRLAHHAALEEQPRGLEVLERIGGALQHDVRRLVHLPDDRLRGELLTRARSPWLIETSPMLASDCIASRMAGRPTPNRSISSRSEGMASPGFRPPSEISRSSRSSTSSESLRRMIRSVCIVTV